MKKIIISIIVILFVVISMIPIVGAAVIPTTDWVPIYSIETALNSEAPSIPIRSLTDDQIGVIPEGYNIYGFRQQYIHDSNQEIPLLDGSKLVYKGDGSTWSLEYHVIYQNGINNGLNNVFVIVPTMSTNMDVFFIVDPDGYIAYLAYNISDGNVFGSFRINVPLYTNVYSYYDNEIEDAYTQGYDDGLEVGQNRGYDNGYRVGYNNGFNTGKLEGYESGYAEGVKDSNADWVTRYEEEVQHQSSIAYDKGYSAGVEDSAESSFKNGYDLGVIKGQQQSEIIPAALDGFWDSMVDFFSTFLTIGVGNLTLYSLLGVLLVTFVTVMIVRVIRG